ncbi:MAG: 4-hydroxy-tetrahydrodipicolinate synthase [Opitutales bacterium]|nr:4-hydroxy-tetrahydrodipicolinate synthase [Opitutales bacterium]
MIKYGVYTALVTPFINGAVSYDCLKKLLDSQILGGVSGVMLCVTTSEGPTISSEEYQSIIKFVIEYVAGKIEVWAGVGSNNTETAVHKTILADKLGVDGMLAVTPYYNKPTQNGLIDYFGQIALATNKPVMMYSVPSRCGVEISVDTVSVLRNDHRNICALKEATDNCARVDAIREVVDDEFCILSGNDSMTLPFMSVGARGVVSVMSNLYPKEMVKIVQLAYDGNFYEALKIYRKIYPVMNKLFIEVNPLPIKFLLKRAGIIKSDEARSPLGTLSEKSIFLLKDLQI